jgi:peptidyl-prolyl cis-trans isomerase SurA
VDIPAEQSNKSDESIVEAPQPEEPEKNQPVFPSVTTQPDAIQQTQEKPRTEMAEQKHEVIQTPQAPILLNRVVAVVNKEVITWSELYRAMEFEAATQIKNLSEEERKKIIKQSEPSFLESLISTQLQLQEAQRLGIEVTQKEITETIETIRKKYSLTEADFMESLRKEGLNLEEYKKRLSEQILINKVVTHQIRNKIIVSDDSVKKYMEEYKANFSGIEKYKLRQIFFKKQKDVDEKTVEEKAALIIKRLKDGEDFSALARIYSDDSSKKMGGDLGFVNKNLLAKEFVDIISNMKIGDYSMPFWTERGLHIIKLDEIVFAQNIDKTKEEVRKKLVEEQFTERYKSWIKSLREKAYIEVRL